MRFFIYFLLILLFCFGQGVNANPKNSSSLNNDERFVRDVSSVDDDEEITWPFDPDEWGEDVEEEEVVEEEPVEEENEEWVEESSEEDENIGGSSSTVSKSKPSTGKKEKAKNPLSEISDPEWDSLPGVKVPYFFLVDSDKVDSSMGEYTIVDFKALKYGGQILSGIPFTYDINSGEVYITDNMGTVPEHIRYIDETEYVGVVRFDYEVAQPQADYDQARTGRRIVVSAEKTGSTIASAYEAARNEAFTKAVRNVAQQLRQRFKKDEPQVKGVIKAWEVLNEGYIQESESFYLEMRVWVTFEGYE